MADKPKKSISPYVNNFNQRIENITDAGKGLYGLEAQALAQQGLASINGRKQDVQREQFQTALDTRRFGTAAMNALSQAAGVEPNAAMYALGAAGDIAGGFLNAAEWSSKSEAAAQRAGAMAEVRNDKIRDSIITGANEAFEDINRSNAASGGRMNDEQIAARNQFERGMAGIDSSGIEGSQNMERNLQYGLDKAEAGAKLQFEMMNEQGQDIADSMAQSFSDLSRSKAGIMNQAWGQTLSGLSGGMTSMFDASRQFALGNNPINRDYEMLESEIAKIGEGGKTVGGGVPTGTGGVPQDGGGTGVIGTTDPTPPQLEAPPTETAPPVPAVAGADSTGAAADIPAADDMFNFYTGPNKTGVSNAQSLAFLDKLLPGNTPEIAALRKEADDKMREFNERPNREARRQWTNEFMEKVKKARGGV